MKWVIAGFLLVQTTFIQTAFAYIPPTRMILQRTTDNSGDGAYQIEKEVNFNNPEIPVFKETWQLESERLLRLTVTPVGMPSAKLTILYAGGQKHVQYGTQKETTRIPFENAERIFHFRTPDNFIQYLNNIGVLTTTAGNLDLAKLSRSQGVVNYGLGKQTEAGSSSLAPYLWIEQDRFVVRKVRFESGAELTADLFQTYAKGLYHPSLINVDWADQKVRITTNSVVLKKFTPQTFQSNQLEDSQNFNTSFSKWSQVLEFYKRFR